MDLRYRRGAAYQPAQPQTGLPHISASGAGGGGPMEAFEASWAGRARRRQIQFTSTFRVTKLHAGLDQIEFAGHEFTRTPEMPTESAPSASATRDAYCLSRQSPPLMTFRSPIASDKVAPIASDGAADRIVGQMRIALRGHRRSVAEEVGQRWEVQNLRRRRYWRACDGDHGYGHRRNPRLSGFGPAAALSHVAVLPVRFQE